MTQEVTKNPPRTPLQRLQTLKQTAEDWIDSQIDEKLNRPSRHANMRVRNIARLIERLTATASKECFFFDPSLPHGGPNPTSTRKYSKILQWSIQYGP